MNHALRLLLGWATLFLCTLLATASETGTPDLGLLVGQLNDASAPIRDRAEKNLLNLGPDAIPSIVRAKHKAVGEAAFRLRCIERYLQEKATGEHLETALETLSFSVQSTRALQNGKRVRINLSISWGDQLTPLVMQLPCRSIVADSFLGESLPPSHRQAVLEPLVKPNDHEVILPLMLEQIVPPIQTIKTLRGTVNLSIAGIDQGFELPLQITSTRIGKATVSLLDINQDRETILVKARVQYDASTDALASHRPWLEKRLLTAIDSAHGDRELIRQDQHTVERTKQGLTAITSFLLPQENMDRRSIRLRWVLPIAIHEIPVNFLVEDITLTDSAD